MEERIRTTITDGVADVRLVRSDKMNALDDAMFMALLDTGEKLKADKSVRAVVVSGEGRAFCAGLDMGNFGRMASGEREANKSEVTGRLEQRTHGIANRAQYAALVWRDVPVPVIAAVHGVAFGGGFQVALGADMRFVAPGTRFSVMEIKLGPRPRHGLHGADAYPLPARTSSATSPIPASIFEAEEALHTRFRNPPLRTIGLRRRARRCARDRRQEPVGHPRRETHPERGAGQRRRRDPHVGIRRAGQAHRRHAPEGSHHGQPGKAPGPNSRIERGLHFED